MSASRLLQYLVHPCQPTYGNVFKHDSTHLETMHTQLAKPETTLYTSGTNACHTCTQPLKHSSQRDATYEANSHTTRRNSTLNTPFRSWEMQYVYILQPRSGQMRNSLNTHFQGTLLACILKCKLQCTGNCLKSIGRKLGAY